MLSTHANDMFALSWMVSNGIIFHGLGILNGKLKLFCSFGYGQVHWLL